MFNNLFHGNKSLLAFGLLLTFFSSFGQTFLISLYLPSLVETFDLTMAGIGGLYGIVTIASAFLLTLTGKYIDRTSLRYFSLASILVLILSLIIMATAQNFAMMVAGMLGLRFAGQGLLPHASITAMARYFDKARGKAISVATLGHPIGEAVFPVLVAVSITSFGWRNALLLSAGLLAIVLLPYLLLVIRKKEKQIAMNNPPASTVPISQWKVLSSPHFWLIAPNVFLMPMITTAFFFYQVPLAESKGWSIEWMALGFTGFAMASSSSMVVSGWMIDRFSARKIFPFYLIPLIFGLSLLLMSDAKWITFGYLLLTGIGVGFGSTLKSALQVELFGTASIGAVRAVFSTIIVLSTAFGPALVGWGLDRNVTFHQMIMISIGLLLLVMVQSFRVLSPVTTARIVLRLRKKH